MSSHWKQPGKLTARTCTRFNPFTSPQDSSASQYFSIKTCRLSRGPALQPVGQSRCDSHQVVLGKVVVVQRRVSKNWGNQNCPSVAKLFCKFLKIQKKKKKKIPPTLPVKSSRNKRKEKPHDETVERWPCRQRKSASTAGSGLGSPMKPKYQLDRRTVLDVHLASATSVTRVSGNNSTNSESSLLGDPFLLPSWSYVQLCNQTQ